GFVPSSQALIQVTSRARAPAPQSSYCDCKILSTSIFSNTGVKLPGESLVTVTFCVCSSPSGPATTTVYSPGATGTRTGVSWLTLMVAFDEATVLTVPQGTALISM